MLIPTEERQQDAQQRLAELENGSLFDTGSLTLYIKKRAAEEKGWYWVVILNKHNCWLIANRYMVDAELVDFNSIACFNAH